jgi:hypothetical protein
VIGVDVIDFSGLGVLNRLLRRRGELRDGQRKQG